MISIYYTISLRNIKLVVYWRTNIDSYMTGKWIPKNEVFIGMGKLVSPFFLLALTIQHLWRTWWQNQIIDVPNKSLIIDPTIP